MPVPQIGAEEKRSALESALQSRTFSRSEQLRAFLRFVCERRIEGREKDLTEHVIGIEVLGRPPDYSPSEDSSVRTRAYELRHKLEKLYSVEAPDAPVRIVLPKGSYVPQFVRREAADTSVLHRLKASGARVLSLMRRADALPALLAGILLGATATTAVVLALRQEAVPPLLDPILAEAWGPLSQPDANVLLCVATPLHLTVGPASHEAYGSPTYPAPPEAYSLFRRHRPLAPGARLGLIFTDNVLGVGTMKGVISVVGALKTMGVSFEVLPERVAPISALRNRNAVLFGAPVDSDAISKTLENAPLTVDYEESVKEFVIRDREKGEFLAPRKDAYGDFVDVYGLITVMHNRDSDGGRLGTIVFAGITSTGTHGAAEFFSSPRTLRELRTRFSRQGIAGFPPAYQVVIRCTFSNMLLLTSEYHSHRVLRQP